MKILKKFYYNQKGIALPMVLSCIVIVSVLVFEFSFSQRISYDMAANEFEALRAEYLAKSGLSITLLKLKIHRFLINKTKTLNLKPEILNMVLNTPIVYPVNQMLAALGAGSQDNEEVSQEELDIEDLDEGNFVATSQGISGINLNYFLDEKIGQGSSKKSSIYEKNIETFKMKLSHSFEQKKENDLDFADKYIDLNIDEVAENIVDWIDSNKEKISGGYEDEFYQNQEPPYRAKNEFLSTFDELLLVEGVNDDIWELLRKDFSIYSEGQYILSEVVKNTELLKWLSNDQLTDDNIKEIQEDFGKEETTWDEKVENFEDYIRTTYRVDFNDNDQNEPRTPHIEITLGDDLYRFNIKSIGVYKNTQRTIEAVVDTSGLKFFVYLYYDIY